MKKLLLALLLQSIICASAAFAALQSMPASGQTWATAKTVIGQNFSYVEGLYTALPNLTVETTPTTGANKVPASSYVLTFDTNANGLPDKLDLSTAGIVETTSAGVISSNTAVKDDAIEFVIDGGGSAITTGVKGFLEIPFTCTINRATLLCDATGSIVVDVWKDTYDNYPPTVADTITASAKPTVSTSNKGQVTTLTGWTTSITSGQILGFNVDSAATVTRCTISLKVTK
jgi:hypothetical protein